jgi:hypothetical protein
VPSSEQKALTLGNLEGTQGGVVEKGGEKELGMSMKPFLAFLFRGRHRGSERSAYAPG